MPFTYKGSSVVTTTGNATIGRFSGGSATSDSLVLTNYVVQAAAPAAGTGTGDQLSLSSGNDLWVFDDMSSNLMSRSTIQGSSRLAHAVSGSMTQNQAIDLVYAGDGNDVVSFTAASGAAATYDTVNVQIHGESGNDVLWAAGGNDTLFGGIGNDWLDGGAGNDVLNGEAGNNTLYGGAGNDVVWGGANNDTMYGGDGRDTLAGGDGNNTIWGGSGDDIIWGGGSTSYALLFGDDGNDTLGGGQGSNVMFGGAGNDLLDGKGQNDTLDGGTGNDTMWGADGDNLVWGGDGNDTVQTGSGDDYIYGGGSGTVSNGDLNVLYGGAGDDWYYVSRSDGGNWIQDGSGSDNVVLFGQFAMSGSEMFVAGTGVHDTTSAAQPLAQGYVLGSNSSTSGVNIAQSNGVTYVTFAANAQTGVAFYTGQIQSITLWNNDFSVTGHTQEIYNWNGTNFTFDSYA